MSSALRIALAAVCVTQAVAPVARADYLKASRPATLHAAAQRTSAVVLPVQTGDVLRLLEPTETAGYYHAAAGSSEGWVYRTFVRRFSGDPPAPSGPGGTAPGNAPADDATPYLRSDCPLAGTAKVASVKAVNLLKNRALAPVAADFSGVTLADALQPDANADKYDDSKASEFVGFVHDVKFGGMETCNCGAADTTDRDTHIELTPGPQRVAAADRVIVEVTPAWRKFMAGRGVDWDTSALKARCLGRWIRVRGWLLFDVEHVGQAENTNPGNSRNWRGTCWEIHPITQLEVLSGPPADVVAGGP